MTYPLFKPLPEKCNKMEPKLIKENRELLNQLMAEGTILPMAIVDVLREDGVAELYPNFHIYIEGSPNDTVMEIDNVEIRRTADEADGVCVFDSYADALEELEMQVDGILDNVKAYFIEARRTKISELRTVAKSRPPMSMEEFGDYVADEDETDCTPARGYRNDDEDKPTEEEACEHEVGDVWEDQWISGDDVRFGLRCKHCGAESWVDVDVAHVEW